VIAFGVALARDDSRFLAKFSF